MKVNWSLETRNRSIHQYFQFSIIEMFQNIEELEVEPLMTTKSDAIVWNIFPEFGNKKEEEMQEDPPVEE